MTFLSVLLVGYLLGSVPSGVWLGKALRGIDVRDHGSKSIGATNVFRLLGRGPAIAVMVLDVSKGFLACLIASRIDFGDIPLTAGQLAIVGGLAAVLGHLFPVFAGFRGGKGVATGAGILLFLLPLELALAAVVFAATVAATRYVSLGSIVGASFLSSSILVEKYILRYPLGNEMVGLALTLIALILFTHRTNIARLARGEENKIGSKGGSGRE